MGGDPIMTSPRKVRFNQAGILFWCFTLFSLFGYGFETLVRLVRYGHIEGTQGLIALPFSQIYGFGAVLLLIFYPLIKDWSNRTVYNQYDGRMIFTKNAEEQPYFYPNLSSSGPTTATSRPILVPANSDLYTQYFVFQMRTNSGSWDDVGNTDEFKLKLTLGLTV